MRLREQSELGWLMLQVVGALALPHVTRDAQLRAEGKERLHELFRARPRGTPGLDRVKAIMAGALLDGLALEKADLHPAQRRHFEGKDNWPRAGAPHTRSYSTRDGFWWLSYADDHQCAGVAIVRLVGEPQTAARADAEARRLGIVTLDESFQCAGIQAPEEERALMEAHAGRFLTTTEATALFGAQSIRSFKAENWLVCIYCDDTWGPFLTKEGARARANLVNDEATYLPEREP